MKQIEETENLLASRLQSRNASSSATPTATEPLEESFSETLEPEVEKKKPKKKKRKKRVEYQVDAPVQSSELTQEEYEESLEVSSLIAERKRQRRQVFADRAVRIFQVMLILASVYMVFLIYGVIVTDYTYNDNGKVVPEVLQMSELAELQDYKLLESYYIRTQALYEDILELDYKLAENEDTALLVALEYQDLLTVVDKLVTDLAAEDVDTKYTAIYAQLRTWVATDTAVYLQNISGAITSNSEEKANNALIARNVTYSDFAQITQNMVTIANNTKGATVGEIYKWSPESFSATLGG